MTNNRESTQAGSSDAGQLLFFPEFLRNRSRLCSDKWSMCLKELSHRTPLQTHDLCLHLYIWSTHHAARSMTCQAPLASAVLQRHLLEGSGQNSLTVFSTFIYFCLFFFSFFSKYSTITALEQRQQYKDDFCAEYDEYRALHDRIGAITEMFVQLGSKINTLSPGTQEYKVPAWTGRWFTPDHRGDACILLTFILLCCLCRSWRTKYYKSIESIRK